MKIIVGASKPNHFKIGALLIMWWEETPASHVYFYIPRISGIHLLYQAVGSGVQFMGYQRFLSHNIPVIEKEIDIPDGSKQKLLDYLIPRLGTKYSIKHLFGLFIKRFVLYVFRKRIKNWFADGGKSSVCVEALMNVLDNQGVSIDTSDAEDVGMQEAFRIIETMPGKAVTL